MQTVKDVLERAHQELGGFETALRGLKNQNIADIVASARAKLAQAMEHADAETELDKLEPADAATGQNAFPFGDGHQGGAPQQ